MQKYVSVNRNCGTYMHLGAGSENENQIACRITAHYIQRVHCTGTASSIPKDTDVFCKYNSDNNSSEHQITLLS